MAGLRVKEIDNDIELFPYLNDDDEILSDHDFGALQANHLRGEESKSALDMEEIQVKVNRRRSRFAQDDSISDGDD